MSGVRSRYSSWHLDQPEVVDAVESDRDNQAAAEACFDGSLKHLAGGLRPLGLIVAVGQVDVTKNAVLATCSGTARTLEPSLPNGHAQMPSSVTLVRSACRNTSDDVGQRSLLAATATAEVPSVCHFTTQVVIGSRS
ncbi:hypothetical protein ASG32_24900 [Methylobacterium sp. Leaf361]|nr:hypothetical protein ASG32_24900 [Methylobacterium sp. Leaf361]